MNALARRHIQKTARRVKIGGGPDPTIGFMAVRAATRQDYLDRIRRVLRFVQEHLDDDVSPAALARVANLSTFHFHRIFSGLVGESLAEHVRRLRLERAAGELRRTDSRVIDVALGAGYDAHEPFTRAFHAHFGVTPSEWRSVAEPFAVPGALCGVHYGTDDAVSRFVAMPEGFMMIDVQIESHPAQRLLALAHSGDFMRIGPVFKRLLAIARSRGLAGPETPTIGIYYDDAAVTPVEALRSHACIAVPLTLTAAPDGLELIDLPEGDVAVGVHRGPYERLEESYRWLFGEWLPSSGREADDRPCYETYVTDPSKTPPQDLITHISIPLVTQPAGVRS
jgi:AraC family transcriptional regulator